MQSVNLLFTRRRRLTFRRIGLGALLFGLIAAAAAVPVLAVHRYGEVLQYAYRGLKNQPESKPEATSSSAAPQAATQLGTLTIRTDPERCAVYLDEVYMGQSPLRIKKLAYGRHSVEVKRFPFSPATKTVEIYRENGEIFVELRQRTGQIQLLGPVGAGVAVDGEHAGTLPTAPLELAVGPHQVDLLGGYGWSRTVEVVEGQRLTYDVTTAGSGSSGTAFPPVSPDERLPPLPPIVAQDTSGIASLLVNSRPWGEVYFDDRKLGFSPILLTNIAPGIHSLKVKRRGFKTVSKVFQLKPGERASVNMKLEQD